MQDGHISDVCTWNLLRKLLYNLQSYSSETIYRPLAQEKGERENRIDMKIQVKD